MRNRNDILADIVVALGGTVTDASNRNQLLRDWLDAVGGQAVPDGFEQWFIGGDNMLMNSEIVIGGE